MAKGTRRTAGPAREGFAALITVITEEEMLEAAHASLPQESKRRRERGTNGRGWSERASAQPGASEAAPPPPTCTGGKQGPGKRWTRDLRLRGSSRPTPCCHEDLRTPELKSEAVTYTKEFFLPPGVKYLSKDSNRIVPSC